MRLDLCINMDSSVELKQFVTMILARGGAIPHVRVLTSEDNVAIDALVEFTFGENVRDLKLSLPGMEYIHYFELKGWEYQGQTFVTWTEFVDQNGTLVNQPNVTVGQLALGDFSRSNGLCQPFEGYEKGRYQVRDVRVEVDYCTFRGGGETTGMRLVGLALSGPFISETIQLKENELSANQVFFAYHHHNSCDALSIDLPSIKLGLRSTATFTMQDEHCTKPFYLAPGRDPLRSGEPGILYELEIPGASKVEGHIAECSHVLNCGSK